MRELRTTQLPRYEVRKVLHEKVGSETGMKQLADLDGAELTRAVMPLVMAYDAWIKTQRRIHLDRSELEQTRDALMQKADQARLCRREPRCSCEPSKFQVAAGNFPASASCSCTLMIAGKRAPPATVVCTSPNATPRNHGLPWCRCEVLRKYRPSDC